MRVNRSGAPEDNRPKAVLANAPRRSLRPLGRIHDACVKPPQNLGFAQPLHSRPTAARESCRAAPNQGRCLLIIGIGRTKAQDDAAKPHAVRVV
jgi:hypothetical protein